MTFPLESPRWCKCGRKSEVVDCRDTDGHEKLRRRRQCSCGEKWTTYEIRAAYVEAEAAVLRLDRIEATLSMVQNAVVALKKALTRSA